MSSTVLSDSSQTIDATALRVASVVADAHRLVMDGPAGSTLDRHRCLEAVRSVDPLLPSACAESAADRLMDRVGGLDVLAPLLADDDVCDVLVNGDGRVWVERAGQLEVTGLRLEADQIMVVIERAVAPLGLRADRLHALVDARLPDGSRLHAVLPPLAVDGPTLAIRRFRVRSVPLEQMAQPGVVALLDEAIGARSNIVVVGGTGAGKTTALNALAARFPPGERLVTIEDTAELRLPGEHLVRLEARPAGPDGVEPVGIDRLLRASLRLRPDRLIIGEVRGSEALTLLQALNTGHDGSLSTCHANGPAAAMRRIEALALGGGDLPVESVREHLRAGVDLVVGMERCADGSRRITEVAEVDERCAPGSLPAVEPLVADGVVVTRPKRRPRRDA
jgi:pilus assembly protein CpaF